jgi:HrpA-like RNA helicase
LSEVLLSLFANSISTLKEFKFLDNPPSNEWCAALDELMAFEFVQASAGEKTYPTKEYFNLEMNERLGLKYTLTDLGERIKRFPLSPMLSRFLLMGHRFKCLHEAVTVAAFCSTDDFFLPLDAMSPAEREEHAIFLRTYASPKGDFFRLINVYRHFKKLSKSERYNYCAKSGLNAARLEEVLEIRKQLRDVCLEEGIEFESNPYQSDANFEKAIIDSFFLNVCIYSQGNYLTMIGRETVFFHPSSCLSRQYPTTVVYVELVRTNKLYMRLITPVDRSELKPRLEEVNLLTKVLPRKSDVQKPDTPKSDGPFKPTLKNFN